MNTLLLEIEIQQRKDAINRLKSEIEDHYMSIEAKKAEIMDLEDDIFDLYECLDGV